MTPTEHLTKAQDALRAAEQLEKQAAREDKLRLSLLGDGREWRASVLLSQVCRTAAQQARADYEQHINAATAELVA